MPVRRHRSRYSPEVNLRPEPLNQRIMMKSPARQYRERTHAAITAAADTVLSADGIDAEGSAPYRLMLAALLEDKRMLHAIKSIEGKIETKRKRLPHYEAWVAGRLEADEAVADQVVATVMVWRVDIGDIDGALQIARYMLRHGLPLPQQYKRDLSTLLVEEIADRTVRPDGGNVTLEHLLDVGQLTATSDMPDEVRAKLHKATGLALCVKSPAQAIEHLQRALQLNPRSGVKAEITKLQKQLSSAN